ncbi:MAG TPA: MFS transporter [Roseiflexaceae bacterium]
MQPGEATLYNRSIHILLVGANLWYIGEGMFAPLLSVYAQRIGGNILDLTGAWSAYLFVTGLCMLAVGASADRALAPERLMVAGYALNAICTFSYLLVVAPWQLLLVQAGLGVASALATPTWNVLYTAHAPSRRAGMFWGIANSLQYLISGCAVLLGGFIVYLGSFTLLFAVMGFVQLIALATQLQILRETAPVGQAHAVSE